jgi:hypothetical protein
MAHNGMVCGSAAPRLAAGMVWLLVSVPGAGVAYWLL